MSRLVVLSVGPATSVQDAGRFGAQRYGLTTSGAMDRVALAMANDLAGNAPFAAAIEIGPFGASFTARHGAIRVALAGAARVADIAGSPLLPNETGLIAEGETLKLGPARNGVFSYLAIEGGINGEPVFGSLSVNARAGVGSPFPRPLQGGDTLDVGTAHVAPHERALDTFDIPQAPVRVVMGPQDDEFGAACDVFLNSEWRVSTTSDRMGYRLEGPKVVHSGGHNIVSDGAVHGSIQVPGNGQPIVLMADHGTTGGYPKIATVISADLGRLAQMPPGSTFRFKAVSVEDAQAEARKLAEFIHGLPGRIHAAGGSSLNLVELQKANVAGIAVNATDAATWQIQKTNET
ncbi:MAG: allophanate hydrolase [Afipia sp. 62-7]|nr:biotin-dependent carboxyltransferase [Afipia sp.]OJU14999.1 MAG: allophanate hydrolase [Afipia sp. 62-7]